MHKDKVFKQIFNRFFYWIEVSIFADSEQDLWSQE